MRENPFKIDICKFAYLIILYLCFPFAGNAEVKIYPAPATEPKFEECSLKVDGKPTDVYACRVSKFPINQWWPGYQRPLDQTEMAGFAYWDMKDGAEIEITTKKPVKKVVVRPLSLGIKAKTDGNKISFKLDKIIPLVVEMDGPHNTLHLFPSPMQDNVEVKGKKFCCPQCNYCAPQLDAIPENKGPYTYYFAAGLHDVGTLQLKSNDTVYIEGGAVVFGSFIADNADNITISGRGILDCSHVQRADKWARAGFGCLHIRNCTNVKIEGIILRDPNSWGCTIRRCQNVDISNLKFIGFWRYNSDGIDIWDSRNVTLKNCFIRSFDDAVIIRATGLDNTNILVENCVIWNDWGLSLAISARGKVKVVSDITFKNIDVIRPSVSALFLGNHTGAAVRNIKYENINVEFDDWLPRQQMQKTKEDVYILNPEDKYSPRLFSVNIDSPLGTIDNIEYMNIKAIGNVNPPSSFRGKDAEHAVSNVLIKNLQFNGKVITDFKEANIKVGNFVDNIKIEK